MSSTPPPSGQDSSGSRARDSHDGRGTEPAVRRPRYVVFALVLALVFGAGCWTEGCGRLTFYRTERDQGAALNASIKDDADRAHAEALYQKFVDTADMERGRAIPMAAATFVLGAALLAFAARGLAGKPNTRVPLTQLVAAQAILVCASYYVTRNVRNAELDWQFERSLIHQRESIPADQYAQALPTFRAIRNVTPPAWLAIRTLASGLIIFALTRPRARAYF